MQSAKSKPKKNIKINEWGKFRVGDFFEVLKSKNKLSNSDLDENGFIPVYSSTTDNNGIFGYTTKKANYKISNSIPFYLIFGDHTKSMFIAQEDFNVMDNIKVLQPKIFNQYIVRYIITSWYASIPNIGYARHWTLAKDSEFYLPVDEMGNPDLYFMEQYMKDIEQKVNKSIDALAS